MHTHSRNSHDSEAIISKTAQSAQEKGISAIAVTDHCDIQYFIDRDMRGCIRNSVAETEQAAKEFNGSPMILKGVEIGEGLWNEKYAYEISMQSDYDVIIGSVHAVRYKEIDIPYSCIDFSQMTDDEIDEYLNIYFDDVLAMLNMGLCDIMAHLTCPLRYINGKYKRNVSSRRYEEKIVAILKYVIENAIALEINTSGIGTGLGLLMPDEWIIEKFKDMGGYLITLGSDTHISQNVGNGFVEALDILKKYGFVNCYYYKNRKNIQYTI
jgi:histidinol-phosphatase (PHP family)